MGIWGCLTFPSLDHIPPGFSLWWVSFALSESFCAFALIFSRWFSLLAMKALLVLRSSHILKSGCANRIAWSFSRLHIFEVILWYVFFFWLIAIFFISNLKSSHSSCGLFVSLSILWSFRSFRSSCSLIPHFITFSIVVWSSICIRGQVHRPFPVCGASFGAYFICTSQWSVGTNEASVFQLKVCCWRLLAT